MLNTITLKNFRQFEDKTVTFCPGNTSLRGANEGGKSTIIEAFLYLLGGAKACRNNDFVRWSTKATSCKVEALMTLQGTQIRAVRGKSGAEIYVPHNAAAPTVTGQNEVTSWFAEQMGASLDVVKKMCFAGQKEIGGLLDEGNSRVVEFIEDMSGLDIVEFFITKIQATGKVGVTTALVERANADRAQLESQENVDFSEAISSCEAEIGPLKDEKLAVDNEIGLDTAALNQDRERLNAVRTHAANLKSAAHRLFRASEHALATEGALLAAEKALEAARPEAGIEIELEAAQALQRGADDAAARIKAKRAFDAWPAPEAEWDDGVETLKAFIANNRAAEKAASQKIAQNRQYIAVAMSEKVSSSACGLCGKDVSEFPEVKRKNEELGERIAALQGDQVGLVLAYEEAQENAAAGDAVLHAPVFDLALTRPDLFEVDRKYVPFRVKWIGGEVSSAPVDHKAAIAALKAERLARVNLDKACATAATSASSARVALDTAKKELAALNDLTQSEASEAEETISAKIATREQSLNEKRLRAFQLAEELGSKRSLLQSLKQSAATQAGLVLRLTDALKKTEEELALYDFHNQLIEDLRKARPVVANQLWSIVLLSVSTYLSKMRGEPSIVTREGKTFLVNGRPSTSYSGSALDLLALGIRIALTKVFVPAATMLVLDEPFAACDADRTLQCLGFAAAAGFEQTIIITHEQLSEGLADNIVEV
jgi:hypothetical protein